MNKFLKPLKSIINIRKIITFSIPVLLIFVAFIDTFFVSGQMVTSGWRDILTVNLPEIIYANGQFPLWNNLWITGFPAFADAMSNIYYPFVYPMIQIINDIVVSANIIIISHLIVAFISSYLFFGVLTKNRIIKIVFALTYIFSFALLSRIDAGHEFILVALSWIPLLYYSAAKILYKKESNVKNILIFSLSASLILFSGSLYYIVYPFIFIAIYVLYLLFTKNINIKAILALALSSIIFLLITAVKYIPILFLSDNITRIDTTQEIAYSLESGGSLESNLASLIFGTKINLGYEYFSLDLGMHESSILIGAVSVFLIIIALVYGKKIITIPSFLSIAFVLIWAAAGKTIFSFIHLLPFLDSLRCPGRIWGGGFTHINYFEYIWTDNTN